MRGKEIIAVMERQWPREYACAWDNVGLLIGDDEGEVNTVCLALDATDAVIRQAKEAGADMLITHHPLIFSGMKKVVADDTNGRRTIELIRAGMSAYAMHTNFDVVSMGPVAAGRLSLQNQSVLELTTEENGQRYGIGQVGELPVAMTLQACAEQVKAAFGLANVRIFGEPMHIVKKVAISPGSGSSVIENALAASADVLITGDISHHNGLDAVADDLMIIDAGHYGLESIFAGIVEAFLAAELPALKIIKAVEQAPFTVL